MDSPSYSNFYILAGLYNFSILMFSKLFTNNLFEKYDSAHFNLHGVISVVLWGLAYISVYKHHHKLFLTNFVFAIEKFYYAYIWATWMRSNHMNITAMINEDLLTGSFFAIYGVGDFLFGLFFSYMACSACSSCGSCNGKENSTPHKRLD